MANTHPSDDTGFKQDVVRLGNDVGALKTGVMNVGYGAADVVRSGVSELRQGAQQAVEAARDKMESAKETASDAADQVKGLISRNPVAAVGIAAGVGILIGTVMCRRS